MHGRQAAGIEPATEGRTGRTARSLRSRGAPAPVDVWPAGRPGRARSPAGQTGGRRPAPGNWPPPAGAVCDASRAARTHGVPGGDWVWERGVSAARSSLRTVSSTPFGDGTAPRHGEHQQSRTCSHGAREEGAAADTDAPHARSSGCRRRETHRQCRGRARYDMLHLPTAGNRHTAASHHHVRISLHSVGWDRAAAATNGPPPTHTQPTIAD